MRGYSIFDHAQLGHVPERKPAHPKAQVQPKPKNRPIRKVRGWSTASRLARGPAFHNPFTIQSDNDA